MPLEPAGLYAGSVVLALVGGLTGGLLSGMTGAGRMSPLDWACSRCIGVTEGVM